MDNKLIINGVAMIVILGIIYLLLKRMGLIKDWAERKGDKIATEQASALRESKYFDPKTYQETGVSSTSLASPKKVKEWAEGIKKAFAPSLLRFGIWNDDEDAVYGIFREMSNKAQISQTAEKYYEMYGWDLLSVIDDYFNKEEMAFLYTIINQKPND